MCSEPIINQDCADWRTVSDRLSSHEIKAYPADALAGKVRQKIVGDRTMKAPAPLRLSVADIQNLSSHYLNEGRKQESWQIEEIEINGQRLTAKVSMRTTYVSDADAKGFHLTIFTTLEFLSQLMIIHAHVWAGLRKKIREGWMVESSTRCVRATRDPSNIKVEMGVVFGAQAW